jgi:small subunit ribosomal protein S6
MTAYEAVFIVDPTLSEELTGAIVEKYKAVVAREGGEVNDVDIWDTKRLAYPVKGFREGRYVVFNFVGGAASKNELDRIFRISDDVLRFLIIKQDTKADLHPSKTRAAENDRRAAEQASRASYAPAPAVVAPPVTELAEEAPVVVEAPVAEALAEDVVVEAPAEKEAE